MVADRACEVGSDRVGRTKQLELDEKVRLAVAAHARHNYTSYEEQLSDVHFEDDYLDVRREIAPEVSALLDEWSKASVKSA